MSRLCACRSILTTLVISLALRVDAAPASRVLVADLLVVGGNESAAAAAVQAARLGVNSVVLVNDIDWLGGQFSAEGVGNVDEWTTVNGKRVDFPRSGMFLQVVDAIHDFNSKTYGRPEPGNSFCARLTIEPAVAQGIFRKLVEPHVKSGALRIEERFIPVSVNVQGSRISSVSFARGDERIDVLATLTIDASDFGDVIRLSGAKYAAGPDPKSRFNEPSAPETIDESNRREMNPLTYCIVMRGKSAADDPAAIVPAPPGFEPRNFFGVSKETRPQYQQIGWPKKTLFMNVPAFADTAHAAGPYSPPVNVYTHRRVVDAAHLNLPFEKECLFFNWPVQDYPLDVWPKSVADALESREKGASKKNIVDLSPALRQIVFDDAKRHALGMVRHLQTIEPKFAKLKLTDEFGTADRLPPKPYIREGLRLEALSMLREQDLRTPHEEPKWAKFMPADGVFGFQFNIDFHPTRRQFLNDDPAGPWATIHTATRNWSTHTDRGIFPLRGLVPVERDGLLGASKNIGYSSIVSSALRLHGQMMHCGQAAGTIAWLALEEKVEPRQLAADASKVRRIQQTLARGVRGPGLLLWPYHDLPADHPAFEAATLLAVAGIWPPDPNSVMFSPDAPMDAAEWDAVLKRARPYFAGGDAAPERPTERGAAARVIYSLIDFTAVPLQQDQKPE